MTRLLARAPRTLSALAVLGAGIIVLAGCSSPAPESSASPTASSKAPTSAPAHSGDPSAEPSPSAPALESSSVLFTCDELLTPADIAAYNPALTPVSHPSQPAGSTAATIANIGGLSCQWQNPETKNTVNVAVAHLEDAELTDLKNAAALSLHQVPTYTLTPDEGYFGSATLESKAEAGEAQIFVGNFWMVIESQDFPLIEPGEIEPLSTPAVARLKAA